MTIINLTPHDINICLDGGLTIPASGECARVAATTVVTDHIMVDGVRIPITRTQFGEVEGLPAPQEDTLYVVSSLVATACPGRDDLVIPNEAVRDDKGRIIGCRSLGRV